MTNSTHSSSMPSLCMIPGPVEIHENVISSMASPATSHVDPLFIQKFSEIFGMLRKIFHASSSTQPFIVAGSGTLGWDMVANNIIKENQEALVISTGIFGDWFGACLEVYQAKVTYLKAPQLGELPNLNELSKILPTKPFTLVTLTHVDTSTGVLLPLDEYIPVIRKFAPNALIVVDAVCSAGAEHLDMQGQFIDVLVTASQKALGGPPGLSIVLATERAMTQCRSRGYYFSWKHWLPIMLAYEQQRPSYFATPPVPLIFALHAALKCIPDDFVVRHSHTLDLLHPLLRSYGCSLLTTAPAHTLTAFYLPGSIAPTEFLSAMRNQGIIVAGGIYPGIQHKYIRIGHMGISVTHPDKKHLKRLLEALKIVFDGFGLNPN